MKFPTFCFKLFCVKLLDYVDNYHAFMILLGLLLVVVTIDCCGSEGDANQWFIVTYEHGQLTTNASISHHAYGCLFLFWT